MTKSASLVALGVVAGSAALALWRRRRAQRSSSAWLADEISAHVHRDALARAVDAPALRQLVHALVLSRDGLDGAVAAVLAAALHDEEHLPRARLEPLLLDALHLRPPAGDDGDDGEPAAVLLRRDLAAVVARDPAAGGPLNALLHFKGFQALQAHRAAHALWRRGDAGARALALWLQARASAALGVDIHPGACLGGGLMLDHGTGVVIGATAVVGDDCSFLHGVTLGASGKDGAGDRHPKLGARVLVGAGASVLGNIRIGDDAKVGCGSVVVKPVPRGETVVGVPAKVVGGKLASGSPEKTPEFRVRRPSTENRAGG